MAFIKGTTTKGSTVFPRPTSRQEEARQLLAETKTRVALRDKRPGQSLRKLPGAIATSVGMGANLASTIFLGNDLPTLWKSLKRGGSYGEAIREYPGDPNKINAEIPFFFARPSYGLRPGFYGFGEANKPGEVSELMSQTVGKALSRSNLFDSSQSALNPIPRGIHPSQRRELILSRTGAEGKLPPKMEKIGPSTLYSGETIAAARQAPKKLRDDIPDVLKDIFGPEAGSQSSIGAFPDIGFRLRGPGKPEQPFPPSKINASGRVYPIDHPAFGKGMSGGEQWRPQGLTGGEDLVSRSRDLADSIKPLVLSQRFGNPNIRIPKEWYDSMTEATTLWEYPGAYPKFSRYTQRGGKFGTLHKAKHFEDQFTPLFSDEAAKALERTVNKHVFMDKGYRLPPGGPGKGIQPTGKNPPDAPFPKFGDLPPSSELMDLFLKTKGIAPLNKYDRSDLLRNILRKTYNPSDRFDPRIKPFVGRKQGVNQRVWNEYIRPIWERNY